MIPQIFENGQRQSSVSQGILLSPTPSTLLLMTIFQKVLSVGDSQTGKSCLIKRYCEERFVSRYITTIGVDYGVKKMNLKNRKIAVS